MALQIGGSAAPIPNVHAGSARRQQSEWPREDSNQPGLAACKPERDQRVLLVRAHRKDEVHHLGRLPELSFEPGPVGRTASSTHGLL
jgi:hypothetical protein